MTVVKSFSSEIEHLLGKQVIKGDTRYRMLSFCIITEEEGKTLVCNLLTRKWISVDAQELAIMENGVDASEMDELAQALAEMWFLVPEDHDDCALCDEMRSILTMFEPWNGKYSNYSIMTTLDCNARCFYCYQMGRNKSRAHMTADTALDVAKFIEKTTFKKEVKLQWYGGEPLYNDSVIDIICNYLREKEIAYTSSMITNGYLLSEEVVARAKEVWNLKKIQITIDGPEDIYNKCKAYIYKDDPSPYRRVLSNLESALKAGITVCVRVNMDNHNVAQLYVLADELAERFGNYEKFTLYAAGLYENAGPNNPQRNARMRMELTDHLIAFEQYCAKKKLQISGRLPKAMKGNRCMADANRAVTISPEGNLGKCDHMMETDTFSSIYSSEVDKNMLAVWREKLNTKETCAGCPVYTDCYRLKKCTDDGISECDDAYKKWQIYSKKRQLHREYSILKTKKEG